MLADIDVEQVSGFDTVEVLKAAYRQSCHDRARFLHALLEVGLREQFSGDSVVRLEVPDEFAPDEARAALAWSRRRADSAFDLAWNLHRRLPVLGEAMLAGELDEPRAAAFIRWTSGLTDAQAGWVCEHLIGRAPGWTVGELIEHIQRLVLAIDPDWAEKRYREAVRRRRVVGMRNDDGTATVSGLDLPLDRAVAGCERIDDLARACKRAGDNRPVDHIRADLFLGSLDGSFEGLSDTEIVAHVRTHPFVDFTPSDAPADSSGIRPADQAAEPTAEPVDNAAAEPGDATDDKADDKADDAAGGETPDEPRSARHPETRSQTRPGARSEVGESTGVPHGEARSTGQDETCGGADEVCGGTGEGASEEPAEESGERTYERTDKWTDKWTDEWASGATGDKTGDDDESAPADTRNDHPSQELRHDWGHKPSQRAEQDHPQRHGHKPRQEPRHHRGHDHGQGLRQWLEHADRRPLTAQACSAQTSSAQACSARACSVRAWSVPEIRVELTTLLGLDEHPAHLPGWGMVHAAQARRIVASMLAGQWRYVVCADNGHLLLTGITGRRPCSPAQRPARDARGGGIVELQVTLSHLRELAAAPPATGVWAPLVADLARHAQLAETGQPDTGRPGTRSRDAAESAESAGRRHAGAALRRYVQIRGRVCSWPGCRMPATRTDQDHIHAWADDGATTADNLHLACRHDHRARHLGGWRVIATGPHLIVWTSPLGHSYPSPLPKIIQPAPEPWPRNWPDAPPGRLPADLTGTPDTIMAPPSPPPPHAGGRHGTPSGEADGEAGATSFNTDLEVPPY
ncbi:DUF222 domain-containing protein [Microbispora sp. NEAU-D428]|uniref:HNH endonuclease signature motif containing protein n=1 Tax=Microbispora sitophila TaxID=2771537 RepID=UPI001867A538|nr:HNH endonuclease signature motif containing protein [Microbispora sitophila]MBE3010257.1 DUF222 domain-containing protein [Microbispora sitophila]